MFSHADDPILYKNGCLYIDCVRADDLAHQYGTPLYAYAGSLIRRQFRRFAQSFAPLHPQICFAVKSCGNIHVLHALAQEGCGADIVSGGELHRAQAAGVDPAMIVYAGVGKTEAEISQAIQAGIGLFNIESEAEIPVLTSLAQRAGRKIAGALRINPDISLSGTHSKTVTGKKSTKFGVDWDRSLDVILGQRDNPWLELRGLHMHIGSPIHHTESYVQAIQRALGLMAELKARGVDIRTLDIGGGFTGNLAPTADFPTIEQHAQQIVPLLRDFVEQGGRVILEPGRSIVSHAGILLTRVQYLKSEGGKNFVIVDAGMNHLIRPTLYEAAHVIWPALVPPAFVPQQRHAELQMPGLQTCDVVGPVCESGDYLAKGRALPPLERGDLLAVFEAGAYGMAMASHYNSFPLPAEVWLEQGATRLIRARETYDDLIAMERKAQKA